MGKSHRFVLEDSLSHGENHQQEIGILQPRANSTGRAEEMPLMPSDKNWEIGKGQGTHVSQKKGLKIQG